MSGMKARHGSGLRPGIMNGTPRKRSNLDNAHDRRQYNPCFCHWSRLMYGHVQNVLIHARADFRKQKRTGNVKDENFIFGKPSVTSETVQNLQEAVLGNPSIST
ncbi:unnamed protein product [Larinioides sclopetarius]|uniref:Uncharacterized protein n=1 Tax=Larinioides sclopetarius TaxID=280406 RepID=A0AAV1YRB0_9ARAC